MSMTEAEEYMLLAYIRRYVDDRRIPPTFRQIAEVMGYSSTSVVSRKLRELKEAGKVDWDEGQHRSLRLTA